MINKDEFKLILCNELKLKPDEVSLYDALVYAYEVKNLSTNDIRLITHNYCSAFFIQTLMKSLGIKLRSRGGSNNVRFSRNA